MSRRLTVLGLLIILAPVLGCLANGQPPAKTRAEASTTERPAPGPKERIVKSESEWKQTLTPEQYRVLREKGTERAFTGKYYHEERPGNYVCAGCGLPLFSSQDKFESGSGWPSFVRPINEGSVEEETDRSLGMARTEILCARCGGHLGHVFPDGPEPTGQRYCVNSASLVHEADKAAQADDKKSE